MKNKRGFTIVELVIVIAVVAVLAAVMIPTFSSIVKNANISSDTQLVRNMNVILAAGSVEDIPTNTTALVALLRENGIERIEPKTRNYTFYWLKEENRIILADGGDLPVYPEEYLYERYSEGDWLDITMSGGDYTPDIEHDFDGVPEAFTVTVECNDLSGIVPIDLLTATEGERFDLTVTPASAMHCITKITVTMDGSVKKTALRGEVGQPVSILIPQVTGNIQIYVTVKEYCAVTLNAATADHVKSTPFTTYAEKGIGFRLDLDYLEENVLQDPYEIVTAKTADGTDHFVASDKSITISTLADDTVITLETQIKTFDVLLTVDGVLVNAVYDVPYGESWTYTYNNGNRKLSGFGFGVKIDPRPKKHTAFIVPEHVWDHKENAIIFTISQVQFNYTIIVELHDSKYQ